MYCKIIYITKPFLCIFQAHPADNLLKSEAYRKWQCSDPSEKQASVIIEVLFFMTCHTLIRRIQHNNDYFIVIIVKYFKF